MMNKVKKPSMFNPRYLPTRLMVLVLFLISHLSLKNKHKLGKWLGVKAKQKMKYRAHIARTNLSRCFPEKSKSDLEDMVEDCFVQLATGFIEGTHAWWQDMTPYKQTVNTVGLEHLINAQKKGKGVLLLGGHFAVVDFAIPLLAHHISNLGYMYRPNDNPILDAMIETGRGRSKISSFTKKELQPMKEFMKAGGAVWYGCDQDFGKKASVFTPFFGVPAANITSPSWIVRETGAIVILMGMRRLENGEYELSFSPELPVTGEDEAADSQVWNAQLEKEVAKFPTQYMWVHKRFKTRPEGEAKFY